jgi:hypothetical protein
LMIVLPYQSTCWWSGNQLPLRLMIRNWLSSKTNEVLLK